MAPTVNGAYRGRYAPGRVMFPVKAFNEVGETWERSVRLKQEGIDTMDLVYALQEGPQERSWALQLLSAIVESQPEIGWQLMPQVLDALNDSTSVTLAAMQVLRKLQASQHVEKILDFLQDPNAELRSAAAECLGELDAWTLSEELRPCFSDNDSSVVKSALQAVCCWGENGQTLASSIVQCLDHPSAKVRCAAVQALTSFAEAAERFAGLVAKRLKDSDLQTKEAAVAFFAALGPRGVRRAAGLTLDLLKDPEGRCAAAMALGHMGVVSSAEDVASLLYPGSDTALALAATGLEKRLGTELRRPECAAAFALSLMGEEGGKHADSIAALLAEDLPAEAKASLIRSLACMGTHASGHKGKLLSFLEHPQALFREAACWSFGTLLQEEGIDLLLALFSDSQATVRERAARALGNLQEASLYVDHLGMLLDDPVPAVQAQALQTLAKCGEECHSYAAIVCRMAVEKQGNSLVRASAFKTLGSMGAAGFAAEVASCFEDPDATLRAAAVEAMSHFGEDGQDYLMEVELLRSDPDQVVRSEADRCAMELGAYA